MSDELDIMTKVKTELLNQKSAIEQDIVQTGTNYNDRIEFLNSELVKISKELESVVSIIEKLQQ